MLAVFTAIILVIGSLAAAVYFLAAPMTKEIMDLSGMIKTFAQSQHDFSFLPDSWESFMRETASMDSVQEFFTIEKITQLTKEIGPRLWGLVSGSVNMVLSLAVILIMLLYII